MKTGIKLFLTVQALFLLSVPGYCMKVPPASEKNAGVEEWISQRFKKGALPPFSFVYGGKKSDTFIRNWKFKAERNSQEGQNPSQTTYTYTDKQSGLVVKCIVTTFSDFPAVEWVLKFINTSGNNTPLIEKTAVVDQSFRSEMKGDFMLCHSRGSNASRSDFQPLHEKLEVGKLFYMTPSGGRSSDQTAFPFFNIEMPGHRGILAAVGWTGKWYAGVNRQNENLVSLTAGMEKMNLSLLPGEEIGTPRICLLFWEGKNRMDGHNQFRRFILAHHSRKINGRLAEYPLSGSFDYGDPPPCNEYICLTQEYAIALVKRYHYFNLLPELFWLDAGWYTGCGWNKKDGNWWQNVGNWTTDKERFPGGLKPVADAVHETGAKFMVWFEPERVYAGTQIDREHPEFLIKLPGNPNSLFNLGNPEARMWLTDYITRFLKSENIDYYRQDFNFNPMPYWEANDKPGRIGISEIRHIEGLYAFWDSLLVRFPQLLIDNCASGGRRIDLETTSRSAPLWRTDYQYGEPNGYQCHTFGLNFYLPVHGTAIYKRDNYTFRSGLGATAVTNWEITGKNSEPIPEIRKKIEEFKELRPYFYGDFYPLTESNTSDDAWLAYQLNRPEKKDGIILAFRRASSSLNTISVILSGLEKNQTYELFYRDSGEKIRKKGSELLKGIDLTLQEKPSSLLISYKQAE